MLEGFVGGLFTAWVLSLFEINDMIIEVLQPFVKNIILTDSHYYVLFGLIGLIGGSFGKQL